MEHTTCDRCGKVCNEYLDDQFWSGEIRETADGVEAICETLCDACHRAVAR